MHLPVTEAGVFDLDPVEPTGDGAGRGVLAPCPVDVGVPVTSLFSSPPPVLLALDPS